MTRQISKSRSAAVVRCLMDMDPTIKRVGFRAAVKALFPKARADFIPDAYAIRHDDKVIDLIEVVDTNPISRVKASLISALWEYADQRGWQVIVVGYDSCGGLLFEVSGRAFYPAFLRRYMGDDTGNAIPAALAVWRELTEARP